MKKISVVVPMYNESEVISTFTNELFKILDNLSNYLFEIIFVNDGSTDNTLDLMKIEQEKHSDIIIVNLSRNFGHEPAVAAGLHHVSGDAVIPMDADLQDPPSLIPEMIAKWEEGYEVVNAKRKSRKDDTIFKRKTAGLFYKIISKWSGKVKIPQNVGHFRLISKRVLEHVNSLEEVSRVFRVEVPFVGFKTTEVLFERPQRAKGKTHYNIKSMNKLALDSIITTSTTPLTFITIMAVVTMIFTILSCVGELSLFLVDIIGKFSILNGLYYMMWLILNVLLIVSSFIMLSLAIISQYNARAFAEAQNRPFYIVDNIIKKD